MRWTHEARAQPGVGSHFLYLLARALLGVRAGAAAVAGVAAIRGTPAISERAFVGSLQAWSRGRGASQSSAILAAELVAAPSVPRLAGTGYDWISLPMQHSRTRHSQSHECRLQDAFDWNPHWMRISAEYSTLVHD